ncbi:hypothetical protein [uncultured Litoreibacter sp.]|uniref:hypothetical protein n=1 Tax=uncultured Litoreibacter sp. TaxID=1392394 RepID=UPI002637BEB5|nr:hypothetical protein [uncultured Litoreibacter sp.]
MSKNTDKLIKSASDGSSSDYVPTTVLLDVLPEIFGRNMYVCSMEVFEVVSESNRPLRVDLSIVGFDEEFEDGAEIDPLTARNVIERKLRLAHGLKNETWCKFWLEECAGN